MIYRTLLLFLLLAGMRGTILAQVPPPAGSLQRGAAAPDFHVHSLNGRELRLADLRDKVIVLNFWFIACPPCRVEIPKLNQLVARYADADVVFIAFAPDKEEELKIFLEEMPFHYQVVANATPIAEKYGIRGAPTHLVIDREGRVDTVVYGAIADPDRELGRLIDPLLKK
jgi:peroxiredoxin